MGGGSGAYLTIHVKFIVDPLFMCSSGPPIISVTGSVKKTFTFLFVFLYNLNTKWIKCWNIYWF